MKKSTKKIIKRILAVCVILVTFTATWQLLAYALLDDTNYYTRVTMHEFYNQENIDILFLGASHCYRGINPEITDQELGVNTFNLGSSSQPIELSYLLLQEAASLYDLKHVYVELSYEIATHKSNNMTKIYIMTDYMRPSLAKYQYLISQTNEDNIVNTFLKARRKHDEALDFSYIKNTVTKKASEDYDNFAYPQNPEERYAGKGFVECDIELASGNQWEDYDDNYVNLQQINPNWVTTVQNIINFCKEKDISLTFISAPVSAYRLMSYNYNAVNGERNEDGSYDSFESYDDFISYIREIIRESGYEDIEYADFNLLKEDYWPDTNSNFKDDKHLNTRGANLFSQVLALYINGSASNEDLFYSSAEEKFKSMAPNFYGVVYNNPENYHKGVLLINRPEEVESKVTFVTEQKEIVVKDWNHDVYFTVPEDFSGQCIIEIRRNNEETNYIYTMNVEVH